MFRILGAAFGMAILASFISGGNEAVILVVFFGWIGLYVFGIATGRFKLKCPYCLKRVKLQAKVCHHCGRQVVGAQQPG
jgi:hypothetical protein